jgi:hypothetical protein
VGRCVSMGAVCGGGESSASRSRRTLLSAPDLGPVADTVSLFDVIRQIRPVAISPGAIAAVVIPAIIPSNARWGVGGALRSFDGG